MRFSLGRQSTREPVRPVCARGTVRVLLLVTRTVGFGPVACVDGLTNRAATKSYGNGFCTRPLWCASLGLLYRDEEGYIEMEALCVSPDDPFWMGVCPVAVKSALCSAPVRFRC